MRRLLSQLARGLTESGFGDHHVRGPEEVAHVAPDPLSASAEIPVFPSDRSNRPHAPSSFSTPRLPGIVQPKLVVGEVNDPLEHEADRVADQVMRMPDSELSIAPVPAQLSRKCAACEGEERRQLQTKPIGGPVRRQRGAHHRA